MEYCNHMNIPLTESLHGEQGLKSLKLAMDMFINNKKVEIVKREKLNQVFYIIREESRVNLLYHKNMILHHFFVPAVMNATWFNIFNGSIKTEKELTKYLLVKRKELKYEFYLPKTSQMLEEGVKVIEYALGRKIEKLDDVLGFSVEELYQIASKVRRFSTVLSQIYEAYYISIITVKYLNDSTFSEEEFLQIAQELFVMEKEHGRIVKYQESFTIPKMKATLNFLVNLGVLRINDKEKYEVLNPNKVGALIEKFARDVNDQISINLKFNNDD